MAQINPKSEILSIATVKLDIPDRYFRKAEDTYNNLSEWLSREKAFSNVDIDIYPQGSFRLGTMIKPINDEDEYDIDLVCELNLTKDDISQKRLKELIGEEIKLYIQHLNFNNEIKEGKRCWTLNYSDKEKFHMDILPAISDSERFKMLLKSAGFNPDNWADNAISITDNTHKNYEIICNDWPQSNPRGYEAWFKEKMNLFEAQQKLAKSRKVEIEKVPEYEVKTTLQRAVQILKRHRDIMFKDNSDNKPASIIITTLAGHAYNNESDLTEALINIIYKFDNYIQRDNKSGMYIIKNPVNELENFADRWQINPEKKENFYLWLKSIKQDISNISKTSDLNELSKSLQLKFGSQLISEAFNDYNDNLTKSSNFTLENKTLFDVTHRKKPEDKGWEVILDYSVEIKAYYVTDSIRNYFINDSFPLKKSLYIFFNAETNTPKPFDVYWQVVNTGIEAKNHNQLRGEIFKSDSAGVGGLNQKEHTAYTGKHWVECFIIIVDDLKDDVAPAYFIIHLGYLDTNDSFVLYKIIE